MASVIEEFGVKIGFAVDTTSKAKADAAIDDTAKRLDDQAKASDASAKREVANQVSKSAVAYASIKAASTLFRTLKDGAGVVIKATEKTVAYGTALRDSSFEAKRMGFSGDNLIQKYKSLTQGAIDAGFAQGSMETAIYNSQKAIDLFGSGALNAFRQINPEINEMDDSFTRMQKLAEGVIEAKQSGTFNKQNFLNSYAGQTLGYDFSRQLANEPEKLLQMDRKRFAEIGNSQDKATAAGTTLASQAQTVENTYLNELAKGMIGPMELATKGLDTLEKSIKELGPEASVAYFYIDELTDSLGILGNLFKDGVLIANILGLGKAIGLLGTASAAATVGAGPILAAMTALLPILAGIAMALHPTELGVAEGEESLKPEAMDKVRNGRQEVLDRRDYITQQFIAKGLSREAAIGMVANFTKENATFDPLVVNDQGYRGLEQWDPKDRQLDFVKKYGYNMGDKGVNFQKQLDDQIDFAAFELLEGRHKKTFDSIQKGAHTSGEFAEQISRRVVVPYNENKYPVEFQNENRERGKWGDALDEYYQHKGNLGITQTNHVTINAGNADALKVKQLFEQTNDSHLGKATEGLLTGSHR